MHPEYLAILRLIMAELPRFPKLGTLFREAIPAQGFSYFQTLVRSGQRNGLIREHIDPPTVARMFLGTLLTYVLLDGLVLNTLVPLVPHSDAIDAFVDHMMDMISTPKTA